MRLWFALERKLGVLRRKAPVGDWKDFAGSSPAGPCVDVSGLSRRAPEAQTRDSEALELRSGKIRLFSGGLIDVGNPPLWHLSPINKADWTADCHWSLIADFKLGDIKGVWEANRWSWVYPLVRSYLRDRDPKHAELFWSWVENWMSHNPPNVGVNWKCGQEASFRIFAAAVALSAFADAPATTPERVQRLARLAHVTAVRIEAHFAYAISQNNNHGISEAVGLITIGTLWPELPGASRWKAKGLKTVSLLCDRLIARDGSFSQHSSNYHRVLLDDLCWLAAVMRTGGTALSPELKDSARRAANFLHALLLPDGSVIRYGADDGARVLQLSACVYSDFRPTLAACAALFGSSALPPGPWDDQAAALCPGWRSPETFDTQAANFSGGGLYVKRRGRLTLALRAPSVFSARPSQADQLHLSVYDSKGAVTEDLGTISYNDPLRTWADLSSACFHNVPLVNGGNPMSKVSRFLWLPWTVCEVEVAEHDRLVASHRGFAGFVVRREVIIQGDTIRIEDSFTGNREADLSVRWHGQCRQRLESFQVSCETHSGQQAWYTADEATGLGFSASHYASAEPSHCRVFSVRSSRAVIVTHIPVFTA
jgi:hypothetical protein